MTTACCAASAEELNAQAETMKQSVNELLHLVGGHKDSAAAQSTAPIPRAKKARVTVAPAKPFAPVIGQRNGNRPAVLELPTQANRRNDVPLDGDFRSF
jgi:hypothetical protein